MYIGKFALITYMFSVGAMGVGFLMAEVFDFELFGDFASQQAIDELLGRHSDAINDTEINPEFSFGDFPSALSAIGTLLWNVPSGGLIADLIGSVPFFGELTQGFTYLIMGIVGFSGVCLLITVLTGRDL
jgi:hypothetical protein